MQANKKIEFRFTFVEDLNHNIRFIVKRKDIESKVVVLRAYQQKRKKKLKNSLHRKQYNIDTRIFVPNIIMKHNICEASVYKRATYFTI